MAENDNSTVIPKQPQTNKALDIKEPTHIDDTAVFAYDTTVDFEVTSFDTLIQDPTNITAPKAFSGRLAPSSAPFIIKINGGGFLNAPFTPEPFNVYANIGNYYAIIPPLPSSTNLTLGRAYGYAVKSDSEIWIYFDRLLAQEIWFIPTTPTFTGEDSPIKMAIETGDKSYPYLNVDIPDLKIYISSNNGKKNFRENFLDDLEDTSVSVPITQSPYIVTLRAHKKDKLYYPFAIKEGNETIHRVDLFGHNLADQDVLFVKATSTLLAQNPSKLPDNVLEADQSEATIKAMDFKTLQALEYFKAGYFLGELNTFAPAEINEYDYFLPNRTIVNSGPDGHLPDLLPIQKFSVNTIPPGLYVVVVYDGATGLYGYAPDYITITSDLNKLQIHSVSPSPVVVQNPTLTINGFGFPTPENINNEAVFIITLSSSDKTIKYLDESEKSQLIINKHSYPNDARGNGHISDLTEESFKAHFSGLNYLPEPADNKNFYVILSTSYSEQDLNAGRIDDNTVSTAVRIDSPPVIKFLTNADAEPKSNNKSLVRVDQKTGQVIVDGETGLDTLYIVGQNFGTKDNISVLINNQQQTVVDVFRWDNGDDPTLNAITVKMPKNSSIKGDANIEVRVGNKSSEPFTLVPIPSLVVSEGNRVTKPSGVFTKNEITFGTSIFFDNIPYDHFSKDFVLLNHTNTKVASSVAVSLQNFTTKETVKLSGELELSKASSIKFNPDLIVVPANTPLSGDGTLNIIFNFYNAFNVNFSSPKIFRLQHRNGDFTNPNYRPDEIMTVIGTGFADGMRYNINKTGWKTAEDIKPLTVDNIIYQAFDVTVPATPSKNASIQISNDQAEDVSSAQASGNQNGAFRAEKVTVNDRYSPLLKINQRLPAGIKMYAKGPQITITDKIDANLSIYTQITPFLGAFKIVLVIVRIVVCIIDVICALINPFQLIVAIIALMDCIIDLLSLFPQLAVPIMILSFLQNFVGFLQTFISQITAYVFSIVNSQLALLQAQLAKDFAALAAAEQQAFAVVKQIRDVIAFLEPALQIIQVFKDLLAFAMHFPCASNQGSKQDDGTCPPTNIQQLIQGMVADENIPANTYPVSPGGLVRVNNVVTVTTTGKNKMAVGTQFILSPGEVNFAAGTKVVDSVLSTQRFTYIEAGVDALSTSGHTIDTVTTGDQQNTLATMFCQAVAMQTATLQTMPGFNGLDSFGNPLPGGPLPPGSTSVVPNITPVLPNIAAAIECMNLLTDNIENALNAGQIFVTTPEQGEELVAAYTQCIQNLLDQTNQALGDVCVLAISALNSELKVSPKGNIGPDLTDDFVKTKIGLPSTHPNDKQDAGLVIDLATITAPSSIPSKIGAGATGINEPTQNFGLKQDVYTPIIIETTNKSGQRQSANTVYFNAENQDVGDLITVGDILEIVGGTFNGLQFPIIGVQKIFTAIRLTVKLDLTFEQKLLVGEQPIPPDLSEFDVKIIAHLAGNDAVAVVPADDASLATVHIIARDHHGHEIGPGLANKVAINIESGTAQFVPVIPSNTTDVTGVIQEQDNHYIANLKADCTGTVIVSSSVCGVQFVDIGYHANDPNHAITTRKKTVKIIFTPPIPKPRLGGFDTNEQPQIPGTDFVN